VISHAEGNVLEESNIPEAFKHYQTGNHGHNLGDMVKNNVLRAAVVFEVTRVRVPPTRIYADDEGMTTRISCVTN